MEGYGKLPLLVALVLVTIIGGVILKITDSRKKKKEAEEKEAFYRDSPNGGARPGDDKEEYWKDRDLLKPEDGSDQEFFKDDQL